MVRKIKTKDKSNVVLMVFISALVILGVIVYFSYSGPHEIPEVSTVIIAIVVAILALIFAWDRMKSIKAGLPAEDELSQKAKYKAAYYAYIASIYIALGIGLFEDLLERVLGIEQLTASNVTGLIILLPAVVFIVTMLYFRKMGVSQD